MKRTCFAIALLAVALTACTTDKTIVKVEGGKVQGVETSIEGVYAYKGIPFAAAPVGDLRWKAPQPVTPWKGVKVADSFGPACVQAPHTAENSYTGEFFFDGDPEFSEDCLYLNVWTKAPGEVDRKLPVAMWIHGGGYTAGWGFEPEMDGKVWGSKDVVLVTINYRLGIFGFLAHPLLSAESEHGVSGNYGTLDQIAALKWIHENIAQFGGDPDNITIFGQSAGAMSVKTLLASPLTENLISRAIIQSGGGLGTRMMDEAPMGNALAAAEERCKKVMDWAGYDSLEKMRAASTEEIFTLASRYSKETGERASVTTSPIVDTYVMPKSFDDAVYDGTVKDLAYMIGYTQDDMGMLAAGIDNFCQVRKASGKPVYTYEFARPLPDDEAGTHKMKGAFHSSELWYTFNSLDRSDRPFTEADKALAERMSNCWINFVKTGDPGEGWEPYNVEDPKYMIFRLSEDGSKEDSAMGEPVGRSFEDPMAAMFSRNR